MCIPIADSVFNAVRVCIQLIVYNLSGGVCIWYCTVDVLVISACSNTLPLGLLQVLCNKLIIVNLRPDAPVVITMARLEGVKLARSGQQCAVIEGVDSVAYGHTLVNPAGVGQDYPRVRGTSVAWSIGSIESGPGVCALPIHVDRGAISTV